jgi:5-methylthioribose kinase
MRAISMEDISDYKNLRTELLSGKTFPHFADWISTFLADTLLPTTDLVIDRTVKKERVRMFTNPELCDITEDLVFTEPYYNYKNRNVITPGNEAFTKKKLYGDETLKGEAGLLRNAFLNHAQALLHGDLHTGSIFINEQGIQVIDPEFAFYGPMGYDVGNVIGNLFFAWANKACAEPENTAFAAWIESTIAGTFDLFSQKLSRKFDKLVVFPLYNAFFKEQYLAGVRSDSVGFAGTEIIRRVVGDTKVPELTGMNDLIRRVPMERSLIRLGIQLIKNRREIVSGAQITDLFRQIIHSEPF